MWDVCKSAGSQLWEKWMDVRVSYPSKGFVTAPSHLKKKIASLTGYLLLESEGFFPLLRGGAVCVQGGRILARWHLLPCAQMPLQFPVLRPCICADPSREGCRKCQLCFQPREQNILGSAAHAACPGFIHTRKWPFLGTLISGFGYSCVSAAVLSLMPARLLGMGSGLG